MTWLYLLTLIRVDKTEHVRNGFLSDPDRGLQEYLSGGATNLREKSSKPLPSSPRWRRRPERP